MMKNNSSTKAILNSSGSNIASPNKRLAESYYFWLALLITVVVFTVLVKLGLWQQSRGEEKQQLERAIADRANRDFVPLESILVSDDGTTFLGTRRDLGTRNELSTANELAARNDLDIHKRSDAKNIVGTKVVVTVIPNSDQVFLLDNQTYQNRVGYLGYQLAQIQSKDASLNGKWIAIELGFIAGTSSRDKLPSVRVLPDTIKTLEGRLYSPSINPLSDQLYLEDTFPYRIQNWSFSQLSAYTELDLIKLIIQPIQPLDAKSWAYPQPWKPLPMTSQKHFGYAVQWFVMAAVFLSLCIWLWIKMLNPRRGK